MNVYDPMNLYECAGGFKTALFALAGGFIAYTYFMNGQRTRPYNFYVNLHMGTARFFFGAALGGGFGYYKFGDKQRVHNAYVAERLRRRYPESMSLHATDLWQYKGVPASHSYYQWR